MSDSPKIHPESAATKPRCQQEFFYNQLGQALVPEKDKYGLEPRDYFRASELAGDCLAKAVYSMAGGVERRPQRPEDQIKWARGAAWEQFMVDKLRVMYMVDYVEGVPQFEDSTEKMTEWMYTKAPIVRSRPDSTTHYAKWDWVDREVPEGARPEKDFHVTWEYQDEEYEAHFRPDCILRGIRNFKTGELFPWPREQWIVLDFKCAGGKYGITAQRRGVHDEDKIGGHYRMYVAQLTLYMHFLGLQHSGIVRGSFEFFEPKDWIWDAPQKRWAGGKGQPIPEHQWGSIEYDPAHWEALAEKARVIRRLVERYRKDPKTSLPLGCDRGSGFFMGCEYNDQTVEGIRSTSRCPGKLKVQK